MAVLSLTTIIRWMRSRTGNWTPFDSSISTPEPVTFRARLVQCVDRNLVSLRARSKKHSAMMASLIVLAVRTGLVASRNSRRWYANSGIKGHSAVKTRNLGSHLAIQRPLSNGRISEKREDEDIAKHSHLLTHGCPDQMKRSGQSAHCVIPMRGVAAILKEAGREKTNGERARSSRCP